MDNYFHEMAMKDSLSQNGIDRRKDLLTEINLALGDSWTAVAHGSTVTGLATDKDTMDICVIGDVSMFTPSPPSTVIIGANSGIRHMDVLATKLTEYGLVVESFQRSSKVPYCILNDNITQVGCEISVENLLDIERTNLIIEYLALDDRVKPFLFAIKQFVKARKINNETEGYLSSYTFTMMGLFFLMSVQDPPVIPCLHNLSECECIIPSCLSKRDKKIQGLSINYHDCVNFGDLEQTDQFNHIIGTIWKCQNKKTVKELIMEAFIWFASFDYTLTPMTISSKDRVNIVGNPNWENDVIVFVDPFDSKRNIADSSDFRGAKIIRREFLKAYHFLIDGASFRELLENYDTTKPISTKINNLKIFSGRRG